MLCIWVVTVKVCSSTSRWCNSTNRWCSSTNRCAAQQTGGNQTGFTHTPGPHNYGTFGVGDPTGVASRGYIDPNTGALYAHSLQPFGRNFANALDAHTVENNPIVRSWVGFDFDHTSSRFFTQYMEYPFPNRNPSQYYNSKSIRDAIRKSP